MNKIITIAVLSLMLVATVIATVDIDWFKMYAEKSQEVVKLEVENQLLRERISNMCSCGNSGSTIQVPEEIQVPEKTYSLCDLNQDENIDILDLGEWANCMND